MLMVSDEPGLQRPAKPTSAVPTHPRRRVPTWVYIVLTGVIGVGAPLAAYLSLYALLGWDVTSFAHVLVVVALLFTATAIWFECLLAMRATVVPDRPIGPPPPATALIAAYLPNEAGIILDTVRSLLAQDYPGPLQVILAYNTPEPMAVEAELWELAAEDPRFLPLFVEGSRSKAQNIDRALDSITGQLVGVFDADHQPMPDALLRAWCWLADGADVVQGHCVVRNGTDSKVSRLVATEFEQIYALSHPGRASLHGWGIFGGSNGYWRTNVLRSVGFDPSMLTEDIDASLRCLRHGGLIVSDPGLLSFELATVTWSQLWRQRMRWAQGWFQASTRHLWPMLTTDHLSVRNEIGALKLLGWREVYPWISLQIWPLLAFALIVDGGIDWWQPLWLATAAFTVITGPAQVLIVMKVADPSIPRRWFWRYGLMAPFYVEYKNTISRVAQLREIVGEDEWIVTPRGVASSVEPDLDPLEGLPDRELSSV